MTKETIITRSYARRKVQELNLIDNFLFVTLVNHPLYGKEFSRKLLKTIFKRDFPNIIVRAEAIFLGSNTNRHGARLDLYIEEELESKAVSPDENETEETVSKEICTEDSPKEVGTIYDIEPDNKNNKELTDALPKRTRFYHSLLDKMGLDSGQDYDKLKNIVVIMITPYDPFGYNRMVYTIQTRCIELPDMPYDDGAKTIYLYAKGKDDTGNPELKELLTYMLDTGRHTAVNDDLMEIQEMIDTIKNEAETI